MLKYIFLVICIPNLVHAQPTPPADPAWQAIGLKTTEILADLPKPATQQEVQKHIEERSAYCLKKPLACGDLSSMIAPMCVSTKVSLAKKALLDSLILPLGNSLDYSPNVVNHLRSDCKEPTESAFYLATELLKVAGDRNIRAPFVSIIQWVPVLFKNAPPNMLVPMEGTNVAPLTAYDQVVRNFYATVKPTPLSIVRNVELNIVNWSKNQRKEFYTSKVWRDWVYQASGILSQTGYGVSLYQILKELPQSEWDRELSWKSDMTTFACGYLLTVGQIKNCLDRIRLVEKQAVGDRDILHSILLTKIQAYMAGGQFGDASQTLVHLLTTLVPPDDLYPWAPYLWSQIHLANGEIAKAQKLYEDFAASKKAKTGDGPWRSRGLNIDILIEKKEYAKALSESLALEQEITKDIAGITEFKVWIQLDILMMYAQKKDVVNTTKWFDTINASMKVVPTLTYLTSVAKTLKGAASGSPDLKQLDPARQIVGAKNFNILRIERFINNLK